MLSGWVEVEKIKKKKKTPLLVAARRWLLSNLWAPNVEENENPSFWING